MKKSSCKNCYREIKNPVCLDCLIKHIDYWLQDSGMNNLDKKVIMNEIKENIIKENKDTNEDSVTCTICEKVESTLCSYCFFLNVDNIIQNLNTKKKIKSNFLDLFGNQATLII